ncbi:copper resistance protein CopC [Streptomyces canus]|uniref:copper resistance CopC family protein n=1 Tax=Streptomyces canus TaxID=58343 RepID=UPI0038665314|nr:copper resistance protein CopC [Streptomyces canus]
MRRLRLLRAPAVLSGCLCALLFLGGAPAHAHTALKDATPGPGDKVAPGVEVLALTFGPLKPGTTPKISLVGPNGTAVSVGQPVVAGDSVVCSAVAPLEPGVDTLSYTVVSADGDTQASAFQFEVAEGAEAVAVPAACRGLSLSAPETVKVEDGEGDGDMILGLGRGTALSAGGAAVAVLAGGGVLARRARRSAHGRRPAG